MNDTFGRLYAQFLRLWQQFQFTQKLSLIAAILTVILVSVLVVIYVSVKPYASLYPSEKKLTPNEVVEMKTHLDHMGVSYKVQGDSIFVPVDDVQRTRVELAQYGLPRIEIPKQGFEIFDTNTWIKGEKELQILELRALKGQLEKDLAQFENIRSANVILDIAPPRPFGGGLYKTKASVILNLYPGARLSSSELRAITFHISGAVRGLSPNMIAISDTTGKLYQSIDPEGSTDFVRNSELSLEENLKAKIDGMLALVVGGDNFYSSVQVLMNRQKTTEEVKVFSGTVDGINLGHPVTTSVSESANFAGNPSETPSTQTEKAPNRAANIISILGQAKEARQQAVPTDSLKISSGPGKIETISIAVLIDKKSLIQKIQRSGPLSATEQDAALESLKKEIENQVNTILQGYNSKVISAINFVDFDPSRLVPTVLTVDETAPGAPPESPFLLWPLLTTIAFGTGLLASLLYWSFRKQTKIPFENKNEYANKPEQDPQKIFEILKKHLDTPLAGKGTSTKKSNLILNILKNSPPNELGAFLVQQNPLTVAWLISYLNPERAAEILIELPQSSTFEILQNLLSFQNYTLEEKRKMNKALRDKWGTEFDQDKKENADFKSFVQRCIESMPEDWKKILSNKMRLTP